MWPFKKKTSAQDKPAVILELEKLSGRTLKHVLPGEFKSNINNAFCLDDAGEVTHLNIYDSSLSDLRSLATLTRLTNLYLSKNKITDLNALALLTRLTNLYLSENKITDLTPLSALTRLTTLNLQFNQITDLTPLAALIELTLLYLNSNQITDLTPLAPLTELTELYLENNHIADLTPLASLTRLTALYLQSNRITDLTPLSALTGLSELRLSSNQITDLTPLAALTGLTTLYLNNNQILNANDLKILIYGRNKITDLTPLIPLVAAKNLKNLSLENNQIKHLPPQFLQLEIPIKWEKIFYENGIGLEGNPLETPPIEIIKKGHDAVVSYFKQLEASKVQLLQCKLLIVGSGEVGKTTLMKKLKDPTFIVEKGKESTTHGINITPWALQCNFAQGECQSSVSVSDRSAMYQQSVSVSESNKGEECTVNVFFWDFGGQDIYHSTHQFFLTKRSLYILVWEARKEEESRSFDFWLNVIKLLGSGSPIIVVMNKADDRIKSIDEATLQKKFPDIKGFLKISCLQNTGLKELTELITKTLGQMPHLQDTLPASWLHIRDELKSLDQNYISSTQFFKICEKHQIKQEDAFIIADYLHDLGIILFFRTDPLLADTVILKPEWATRAVYALLDAKPIILNTGSFLYPDLKEYWDPKSYPHELHPQLIRLMEKFELCFNFIHTYKYFIPELLPGEPLEFDTSPYVSPEALHVQYQYKFMPEGILSRFISRLYYLINENRFRKYQVELAFENATALVVSEPVNSRIKLHIAGSKKNELLAIIRSHFNHIHQTLNMVAGNHYNQMIPCPCPECSGKKEPDEPEYFAYEKVNKALASNHEFVQCPTSMEQIKILSLLNGFAPTGEPGKNILEAIIQSATKVLGLTRSMKPDEDSRTGLLCLLMNEKGFFVKDQTRWGQSETGKSQGRLDGMIESPDGEKAILEAFKLDSLEKENIERHYQKLFKYDPVGLQNNFIVVYCDCPEKTFSDLWKRYLAFVNEITFNHPLLSLEEKPSEYANIKIARAIHNRHDKEVGIYHLFLFMG